MKAFMVMKNKDMTEGRGPMVSDKFFFNEERANEYVDEQPGVMGIKAKWSDQAHGDWEVWEIDIIE